MGDKQTQSDQSYTCTANTEECFRLCVGRKVIGVLFSALPLSRRDLASGNKTLIFEDGYGLTISSSGSYWTETKDDIQQAVERKRAELGRTEREIREVLALGGADR